jgi:DNA-binding IclR family transcriptional regulator
MVIMATIDTPTVRRPSERPGSSGNGLPSRTGAIDKTMILYDTLRSAHEPLRLSDLSRRTGLAKSTTHRLLNALTVSGLVARLGVGYIAAPRPEDAQRGTDRQRDVLRRLAPYVCDAVIRTRCTASLATLDGPEVVFSHRVYSHENVPTASDRSGRERAHLTAAGRLLLAGDLRTAAGVIRSWGLGGEEAVRLQNELRQISRRGYAVRMTPQLSCVAVELPVQRDRPRVALAIKGPARSAEIEQWLQVLRPLSDAARDLLAAAESAAAAEAAPAVRAAPVPEAIPTVIPGTPSAANRLAPRPRAAAYR